MTTRVLGEVGGSVLDLTQNELRRRRVPVHSRGCFVCLLCVVWFFVWFFVFAVLLSRSF